MKLLIIRTKISSCERNATFYYFKIIFYLFLFKNTKESKTDKLKLGNTIPTNTKWLLILVMYKKPVMI